MLFRTCHLHFCCYVLSGKYEYCQGDVREFWRCLLLWTLLRSCVYTGQALEGYWITDLIRASILTSDLQQAPFSLSFFMGPSAFPCILHEGLIRFYLHGIKLVQCYKPNMQDPWQLSMTCQTKNFIGSSCWWVLKFMRKATALKQLALWFSTHNVLGEQFEYHCCWCPTFLHHQVIRVAMGIDCVKKSHRFISSTK